MNLMTYIIFFTLVVFITVKVGWTFYVNGEHFICDLIPEDVELAQSINKILLVGYYLLNIGFATTFISMWDTVLTIQDLISSISSKAGFIILGLGIMHYTNIAMLHFYKKYRTRIINKN